MYSWRLFTQVILSRDGYTNPFYLRETQHSPVWYDAIRHMTIPPGLRAGVTMAGSLLFILTVLYVNNLLFFFVPPLIFFLVTTGLTIGPIVAEERVKQSWELVVTSGCDTEQILLGKTGGALTWIRQLMVAMFLLMLIVSVGVGLISVMLIPTGTIRTEEWSEFTLCGILLMLPLSTMILFIIDRSQQYLLLVTAALAFGSSSSSVPKALLMTNLSILVVWLLEIVGTGLLLAVQPDSGGFLGRSNLLALITMGPIANYVLTMDISRVILFTILTLLIREIMIGSLWRLALGRVRSLGPE